jgi:hypothetical protein
MSETSPAPAKAALPPVTYSASYTPFLGWAFAETEDEEQWTGPFDTREDAIVEARNYFGDEDSVAVARCYVPSQDEAAMFDEPIDFIIRGNRETIEPNAKLRDAAPALNTNTFTNE